MAKFAEPPAYGKNVAKVRNPRTSITRIVNFLILLILLGCARITQSYALYAGISFFRDSVLLIGTTLYLAPSYDA